MKHNGSSRLLQKIGHSKRFTTRKPSVNPARRGILETHERFDGKFTGPLKTHQDFVDDPGELLRDKIKILAWEFDQNLITLLLSAPEIASKFFEKVNERWIFSMTLSKDLYCAK